MEPFIASRHHIGHEATFLRLRRKYYGQSSLPVTFQSNDITEFSSVEEKENGTTFRCLTHPSNCFSPAVSDTSAWTSQWDAVGAAMDARSDWDLCRFNLIAPQDLPGLRSMIERSGRRSWATESYFWVIPGTHTWESYQASRRSSFNRNQKRCLRLMEKEGLRFSTELDLEQIFCVFAARNCVKGQVVEDYSVTDAFRGFVTELREQYKKDGRWFEYGVVNGEGRLLAFVLCFRDDDGVFYAFQTGYDPAYRQLRLGAITFEKVIEDALARGCSYISFMGNSDYFAQFTQEKYRFHVVDVFASTRLGFFLDYRRRLARFAFGVKRLAQQLWSRVRPAAATDSGTTAEA